MYCLMLFIICMYSYTNYNSQLPIHNTGYPICILWALVKYVPMMYVYTQPQQCSQPQQRQNSQQTNPHICCRMIASFLKVCTIVSAFIVINTQNTQNTCVVRNNVFGSVPIVWSPV